MRLDLLLTEADSPAEHEGSDQGRNAGADMDDGPAGEVERAELVKPSPRAPDPVRDRVVDEGRPEQREDHEGLEALPFSERAADQGGRDNGKHHLEKHEGLMRDGGRVIGIGRETHVVQADPFEAADDMELVRSEGEAVAPENPLDTDEAEDEKTVHDRREDVLAADEPPIEETECRRHQHHERSRSEDPGGIATIDFHYGIVRRLDLRREWTDVTEIVRGHRAPRTNQPDGRQRR